MFDISAAGASAVIEFADGTIVNVRQFSDEGTPFESPNVTLSTNNRSFQGTMISSRTPSVIPVSITVVPGSKEDYQLQRKAQAAILQPGSVTSIADLVVKSFTLHVPSIDGSVDITSSSAVNTYTWLNGRMSEAPTGPSTSSEGRMSPRTYSFEFEKYKGPTGMSDGTDINAIQSSAAGL